MEYLKVWTSFAELLEPLTDDECGRLFKAMLQYAQSGETPDLTGNERFVWPSARQNINATRDKSEQMKANGSKQKQTEAKPSKRKQTEAKPSTPFDKEKEKVNINIKESPLTGTKEKARASAAALDRAFDKFWAVYPRHTAKQDARKAFMKIAPDDELLTAMLTAIQKQKGTEQWSDPRYIPHPATWLNGHRWEDEPSARAAPARTVSANSYGQRDYDDAELEDQLGVNDLFRAEVS